MLELQVAVAKVPRAGTDESGDTLEMVERPGGGFSFVLVDGQGSGRGAKTLSNILVTRVMVQLKDGARDGVVARSVHDYLYTYRAGQVAATLNIVSADFQSGTIVVTRNNPAPFFVLDAKGTHIHNEESVPIGLHPMTRPVITEVPVRDYTYVVVFTDGLLKAGERHGEDIEIGNFLAGWPVQQGHSAEALANALLGRALELDRDEPVDDMSVLVLAALPAQEAGRTRRMRVTFPLEQTPPGEHSMYFDG
ncbi:MAG TPA: SpoIIE family protein phosphatase [Roseiflexaceae bacterium]|jgi:serine phosphatase RsbU (regulator of sigma subunit)|nr:SpoIIE family protein phosphatase [Roseiflexaceae bacterium]